MGLKNGYKIVVQTGRKAQFYQGHADTPEKNTNDYV